MFTLNKKNELCFKDIIIILINPKNDYEKLMIESSINKANMFLSQSKHIYKTSKLLESKLKLENNIFTLKIKTYNKRYDAEYNRNICFIIDKFNLILISH